MLTNSQIAQASRVPQAGPGEADIRNRICRLLDEFGFDEYHSEYRAGGRAEIILPRLRTIIETKARGGADAPQVPGAGGESPFQQLDRYLQHEIAKVRQTVFGDESDRRWIGILTDGRVWHRWSYEHRDGPAAQSEDEERRFASGRELAAWLHTVLDGEAVGRPWIPGNPAAIFREDEAALRDIFDRLRGRQLRETGARVELWRDMLRSSGMEPETEAGRNRLFAANSFLIALARGVVRFMSHPNEAADPEQLLGEGIASWIVQSHAGRQWATGVLGRIGGYDWRQRRGDVLRPLYEEFVGARDRRDFGEVYTPGWLAEILVRETLDDDWCAHAILAVDREDLTGTRADGIGVLDPCCGSGTFLYYAVRRLLTHPSLANRPEGDQAAVASRLVCGIDIHPVACEFARATMLRALPCEPPGGTAALRVYNGDSLLLRSAGQDDSLFQPRNGGIAVLSPGGREIILPGDLVSNPKFNELIAEMVNEACDGRDMPARACLAVSDAEDREMLRRSYRSLREIVAEEGNSVWGWFMRQIVGPYQISRRRVDRIVSNPPWVKMSTIQRRERKERLRQFALDNDLWQGGRHAASFDIAQLFVKSCRDRYLVEGATAAWVVKHSAIKGGNWAKFRRWRGEAVALGQTLDLEDARVFGGGDARKCCVLIDYRRSSMDPDASVLRAVCRNGNPEAGATVADAEDMIEWTVPAAPLPEGASGYLGEFRRGAEIIPHVLAIVNQARRNGGYAEVETCRSRQAPWSDVNPRNVRVPVGWLVPLLRSNDLLPFAAAPGVRDRAILPLDIDGRLLGYEDARREDGWRELDDIYAEYRGAAQGTPRNLLANLDHRGKLSRQLPLPQNLNAARDMVIYPTSGDIMRACRLRAGETLIDTTLYGGRFELADEAA